MTKRIDHAAKAVKATKNADAYLARIDGKAMSDAQAVVSQLAALNANMGAAVDAQLALVEQQRIANLIALHRHEVKYDIGDASLLYVGFDDVGYQLRPDIREGLGL